MTEDTDLMAVVEPLLPAVSIDEIRAQIVKAQEEAESGIDEQDDNLDSDYDDEAEDDDFEEHEHVHVDPPSESDIKAAFARISSRLPLG
jgi:hypothetical protein